MTIALIAAEKFELAGFAARLAGSARVEGPLAWARMGQWNQQRKDSVRVICAANGPGFGLAGEAAAFLVREYAPDRIWSIGIAGGLEHALANGDLCMGDVVDKATGDRFPMTAEAEGCGPLRRGTIVSQDAVAVTRAEKQALCRAGIAVEMEAAAVARAACGAGIPFGCLKAISDTAHEDFLFDLNRARTSSGRFSSARIVTLALRHGAAGISELARLFRSSRAAVRSLEMRLPCLIQ